VSGGAPSGLAGRILRFGVVGGIGFVVDAAVLWALTGPASVDPYGARLGSFAVAVVVTWLLNRSFTFASTARPGGGETARGPAAEFARYLGSQGLGWLVNFALYSLVVAAFRTVDHIALYALAVGSAAAMGLNFLLASYFVFGRPR
jgi:putative flippase GtrA